MKAELSRKIERFLKLPPEPPAPYGEEQSLRVFRASPRFLKYRIIVWRIMQAFLFLAFLFVFSIAMIGAAHEGGVAVGVGIVIGMFVLVLFAVQATFTLLTLHLDYEMRWYKVTDRSLLIREGIWFVREMTMTFANIQNMEVIQGPIQRWLGIADLKVECAGGGGGAAAGGRGAGANPMMNMHTGYFRGIDNAQDILRMMEERLRRSRSAGLGDIDDPEHRPRVAGADVKAHDATALVSAARDLLQEVRQLRQTVNSQIVPAGDQP